MWAILTLKMSFHALTKYLKYRKFNLNNASPKFELSRSSNNFSFKHNFAVFNPF